VSVPDKIKKFFRIQSGAVAQLGERAVRNGEASGSIPLSSTKPFLVSLSRFWFLVKSKAVKRLNFVPAPLQTISVSDFAL
jgi:hypothetical protein